MKKRIPENFDVYDNTARGFGGDEIQIRDEFKIDITSWAKFRHAIRIGLNSKFLISSNGTSVPEEIKEAYRELGKSHYEIIKCVGHAHISFSQFKSEYESRANFLLIEKTFKEFYFHLGFILDTFSRIVFILNHPESGTLEKRKGIPRRHFIGWSDLIRDYANHSSFKQYQSIFTSNELEGIKNIRNNYTHGWAPIAFVTDSDILIPDEIREYNRFFWHYDEWNDYSKYHYNHSMLEIASTDWEYLLELQSRLFSQAITDLDSFETNHNVYIDYNI